MKFKLKPEFNFYKKFKNNYLKMNNSRKRKKESLFYSYFAPTLNNVILYGYYLRLAFAFYTSLQKGYKKS